MVAPRSHGRLSRVIAITMGWLICHCRSFLLIKAIEIFWLMADLFKQGTRVLSGDCIYTLRHLKGLMNGGDYVPLGNATGCVWDQLQSFDKLYAEIGGDVDKLVIVHGVERWSRLPIVKEVAEFQIVKVV